MRDGQWSLLECAPAWEGNWTSDGFIAFAWQGPAGRRLLVTVNYAPNQGQCYVRLPWASLRGTDRAAAGSDERRGVRPERATTLRARGLYLDLPPWGHHVFEVGSAS